MGWSVGALLFCSRLKRGFRDTGVPLGSGQCLIGCGGDFFEPLGFELGDGFRESTTICDGSQKKLAAEGVAARNRKNVYQ